MLAGKKNIVALIPARTGSKGVKNKNIKLLNQKPLIQYTIEAALSCSLINRVIVSTNDVEIAQIAKSLGAEVPFIRPDNIATDTTPDRPVMTHLLNWLKKNDNYTADFLAYLRPTSPFKTAALIEECLNSFLLNENATSLRTVSKSEGIYHPYWMYKAENNVLKSFIDGISIKEYYQRQLLPECYRLNGVVDLLRSEVILESEDIYGASIMPFPIADNQAIDIDTELDFKFAEFLLRCDKKE